jgi:beta-N-acetylhexosaminidase
MFAQKYREDPAFAERVDQSVKRVLTLKYRLYPEFSLTEVSPSSADLSAVGRSRSVSFEVARQAASLISPDQEELASVLARPPELRDRIVFLTDVVTSKQCSSCPERQIISANALQDTVLRLYGPGAGGQILEILLSSYSFNDLDHYLDDPTEEQAIENDLTQAEWVVVAMLNPSADRATSDAFKRLLTERPDLLRNKRVVAFAFNAPYYLDATDISKITAYYGLYSKTPEFVDVAARLLFQQINSPDEYVGGIQLVAGKLIERESVACVGEKVAGGVLVP